MDGALGTELERRGLPIESSGWSAFAVRDRPEVIREIHEDYIRAGARLHIVNSFSLAHHVLEPIGLAEGLEELNRRAVALFDEAVDHLGVDRQELWVAGSLSTFAANSDRSSLPRGRTLEENYSNQATILCDAGVDLFALEMLFDTQVSLAMLGAVKAFGLPVMLGFTCDWKTDEKACVITAKGMGAAPKRLDDVLPVVIESIGDTDTILSIMHSQLDVTDAALDVLRRHWDGPIAVYPNSGEFVDLQMQFDTVCVVEEFALAALRWMKSGAQIIGGCCGIGPAHIERMGRELGKQVS